MVAWIGSSSHPFCCIKNPPCHNLKPIKGILAVHFCRADEYLNTANSCSAVRSRFPGSSALHSGHSVPLSIPLLLLGLPRNDLGWKRLLKSLSPALNPALPKPPPLLSHLWDPHPATDHGKCLDVPVSPSLPAPGLWDGAGAARDVPHHPGIAHLPLPSRFSGIGLISTSQVHEEHLRSSSPMSLPSVTNPCFPGR